MKKILGIFDWFVGKRTYIVAIILAIFNLAVAAEWITPEFVAEINAILVALGLGALRLGVAGK